MYSKNRDFIIGKLGGALDKKTKDRLLKMYKMEKSNYDNELVKKKLKQRKDVLKKDKENEVKAKEAIETQTKKRKKNARSEALRNRAKIEGITYKEAMIASKGVSTEQLNRDFSMQPAAKFKRNKQADEKRESDLYKETKESLLGEVADRKEKAILKQLFKDMSKTKKKRKPKQVKSMSDVELNELRQLLDSLSDAKRELLQNLPYKNKLDIAKSIMKQQKQSKEEGKTQELLSLLNPGEKKMVMSLPASQRNVLIKSLMGSDIIKQRKNPMISLRDLFDDSPKPRNEFDSLIPLFNEIDSDSDLDSDSGFDEEKEEEEKEDPFDLIKDPFEFTLKSIMDEENPIKSISKLFDEEKEEESVRQRRDKLKKGIWDKYENELIEKGIGKKDINSALTSLDASIIKQIRDLDDIDEVVKYIEKYGEEDKKKARQNLSEFLGRKKKRVERDIENYKKEKRVEELEAIPEQFRTRKEKEEMEALTKSIEARKNALKGKRKYGQGVDLLKKMKKDRQNKIKVGKALMEMRGRGVDVGDLVLTLLPLLL